jgi:hypothetical protein
MTSFLFRAGSGNAGDVTRDLKTTVESAFLSDTNAPTYFGEPVKMVSGKLQAIESGDAADVFFGILSRSVPTIAGTIAETFGAAVPNPDSVNGVIVQGYCNVIAAQGTPVRAEPVYLRIAVDTGKAIGDLETASIPGENVLLVGVTWGVSGKDADNITEIRIEG